MLQMTLDDVTTDSSNNNGQPPKQRKARAVTEKTLQAYQNQIKTFSVSAINNEYLESFRLAKYSDPAKKASWAQYKSTIGAFLECLKKDAAMTKREDIERFLEPFKDVTKANKSAHIKAFLIHLITANVKNCTSKIGRDLLIKLLEM